MLNRKRELDVWKRGGYNETGEIHLKKKKRKKY